MELSKNDKKDNLKRIGKGSVCALILTILLLFIFSIILTYTNIQETAINPIIIIITCISIFVGSSISSFKIKKNGFINGSLVGIIYILLIYIISSIVGTGFSFNMNTIIMIISSIFAGTIGGIIGVNL